MNDLQYSCSSVRGVRKSPLYIVYANDRDVCRDRIEMGDKVGDGIQV
jgi:hypothetical protein